MITIKAIKNDSFQLSDGQVFPIPYVMSKDEKLKQNYIISVVKSQNFLQNKQKS